MESFGVAQAGVKFLGSRDRPASAFQSAGIKSVGHCAQTSLIFNSEVFCSFQYTGLAYILLNMSLNISDLLMPLKIINIYVYIFSFWAGAL